MSDPILDRYGILMTYNSVDVASPSPSSSATTATSGMTDEEQRERRASIKAILLDPKISPQSKRLSIQGLMDGRRRSSCCGSSVTTTVAGGMYASAAAGANGTSSPESSGGSSYPTSVPYNNISAELLMYSASLSSEVQQAISVRMENNRPLCRHYERNCTIISPCCGVAFGCRICHDECQNLPPPFLLHDSKIAASHQHSTTQLSNANAASHRTASMPASISGVTALLPADNQHKIDRFSIAEVICRQCYTRQSSKTNNCIKCHAQFGEYHCIKCNLWMSAAENPYHCNDCGICRVGGRDNFQHCYNCGMCIDVEVIHDHDCKVGKYISNCPVCQDDLFQSRTRWHEMPCGHSIHSHCFRDLLTYDFRCPVCKKSADLPERLINTWNGIAIEIDLQPLPQELAKVVDIFCIDCEKLDERRKWHFLGVQCHTCSGFNTRVERILLTGADAASYLQDYGDGKAGS